MALGTAPVIRLKQRFALKCDQTRAWDREIRGERLALASKHGGVLRKAGLIVARLGGLYQLSPALRPPPGSRTADLGICTLRFDRAV